MIRELFRLIAALQGPPASSSVQEDEDNLGYFLGDPPHFDDPTTFAEHHAPHAGRVPDFFPVEWTRGR